MNMNEIVLVVVLCMVMMSTTVDSSNSNNQFSLKWGDKCKIPGPNEYLHPSEECEMSKGLHCQTYQQGNLCGCMIKSSLSYDEHAKECRRKPGQHCFYQNTTQNPSAYDNLGYNQKCHARAECTIVENPVPEVKLPKKQIFAVCKCKRTFKESRDGLVCHSINSASYLFYSFYVYAAALITWFF